METVRGQILSNPPPATLVDGYLSKVVQMAVGDGGQARSQSLPVALPDRVPCNVSSSASRGGIGLCEAVLKRLGGRSAPILDTSESFGVGLSAA